MTVGKAPDPLLRRLGFQARFTTRWQASLVSRPGIAARYTQARRQARKARRQPGNLLTLARLDPKHWVGADGRIYYRTHGGGLEPIT